MVNAENSNLDVFDLGSGETLVFMIITLAVE